MKLKKQIFSAIALSICLSFIGCGGSNNTKPQSENDSLSVSTATDSTKTDSIVPDSVEKKEVEKLPFSKDSILIQSRGGSPHDCKLLVPPIKVKGIYITGAMAGTKNMQNLVELVTSTEMNAIVLDIKNDGGNVTYKIEYDKAKEIGACVRYVKDMPALLKELHEKGVYVIGRIVCFKDPILAKKCPELALCKADGSPVSDGKGNPWVNPFKKGVWEYICGLAEQATQDGFDEIQFDYVRFPIGADANQANYGVDLATYSREQGLTDFFSYVEKRLHSKGIIFGADLFGTVIGSTTDRDRTGQDYIRIASMTDNICPMIYPSHYANKTFGLEVPDAHPYTTIKKALELSKEQLSRDSLPKAKVRAWLQCFSAPWVKGHINYGSAQIKQQIQGVYDAGYDEWILWNASNHYGQVKGALSMLKTPSENSAKEEVKEEIKDSLPQKEEDTTERKDSAIVGAN